jgi:AbrB family looped-hinge helix DNA binding protein
MRVTSKGQVTIPAVVRRQAGILPGSDVDFVVEGDSVRIVRAANRKKRSRGEMLVARLRGSGDVKMTTDEILALTRGE